VIGCVIDAKPVGLFRMWDEKGPDEKIHCVPINDPMWAGIEGWEDRAAAERIVIESQERYRAMLT